MKRNKKKIAAERNAVEVRYAYEGKAEHKSITVSLVKIGPSDNVLSRNVISTLHPNAKKKAYEAARTLSVMSSWGAISNLMIDENLMRDEYYNISAEPILIKEV